MASIHDSLLHHNEWADDEFAGCLNRAACFRPRGVSAGREPRPRLSLSACFLTRAPCNRRGGILHVRVIPDRSEPRIPCPAVAVIDRVINVGDYALREGI